MESDFTLYIVLILLAVAAAVLLPLAALAWRKRHRNGGVSLNALVKELPDGVFVLDTASRIVYLNPAALTILGVTDSEATGRKLSDLLPRNRRASLERTLSSNSNLCLRLDVDGVENHYDIQKSALTNRRGKPDGYLIVMRNVTALKRGELLAREAKDAAVAASRAKSEFLSRMSQEVRASMDETIRRTERMLDSETTSERREDLEAVRKSSQSLLDLINDVQDFSLIEIGKLELDATSFSLNECLRDTIGALVPRAQEKGLELTCDVQPGVPEALVGDPARLRQVVTNLVGNAIKFTEQGGVMVQVSMEYKESKSARLHFAVSDTGIGIPRSQQRVIFEPFNHANGSATPRDGGVGLGLAICAKLVEKMGGRIWVESEAGRGSVFHFTVKLGLSEGAGDSRPPVSENRPAEAKAVASQVQAGNGLSVGQQPEDAIVDD
jgi:PAS domain S-box-containing protein